MIFYVKDKKYKVCRWPDCKHNYEANTNIHLYCKACLVKFRYKLRN